MTMSATVARKTTIVCKASFLFSLLIMVVYRSDMTTKPKPPSMNMAATINGAGNEDENKAMFSENVEKPALQNAETA